MLQVDDAFQDAGLDVFDLRIDVGEGGCEFRDVLNGIVGSMCFVVCRQCSDACGKFVVNRLVYFLLFADETIAIRCELADEFNEGLTILDMLGIFTELCLSR